MGKWGRILKKSIITVATVSVVGLSSMFITQTSYAETLQQLQNKQVNIQDERSQVKKNLTKAEKEIADLLIDLKELNKEIEQTNKALTANKKEMTKTKKDITKTEDEVASLEEAIEERFEILKERAVSYQSSGGSIGLLDVIFGSNDFNDLISRVTAVTKITESDQQLIDKIDEDKQKVEKKLTELEEMEVELQGMQQLILEQKEENEARKETLKKKEKQLKKKVKKLKMKDSDLASLEAQVSTDIESARTPVVAIQNASESEGTTTGSESGTNKKSTAPTANPAQTANFGSAIQAGYSVVGTPYVWAGKGPGGFDCSGFVSWAYGKAGKSLPSNTASMRGVGTKVSYGNIKPGDLVFFDTYKTDGHVGIYVGGGNFIGAQNSTGVAVANMTSGYWKSKFSGHVRRVN